MTSDPRAELDWLAFRYLAGELTADEAETFELRLANEQPAREALARAVELTQVVAAAEAQPSEVVPRSHTRVAWGTRVGWMAVGGVASLIAVMLYGGLLNRGWQPVARHAGHGQLAAAWSETRTQMQSANEPDLWPTESSSSADLEDELAANTDSMDETMDEIPSWLDAALLGAASDSGD